VKPVLLINVLFALALAQASVSITIISDALSCGVTYNCHSDASIGVICNHNLFNYSPLKSFSSLT
jgi:hypothetical protein